MHSSARRCFGIGLLVIISLMLPAVLAHGAGSDRQQAGALIRDYEAARVEISGFAVKSPAEYRKILDYYEGLANEKSIVHRFITPEGDSCVCIDIDSQSSIGAGKKSGKAALEPEVLPVENPLRSRYPDAAAKPLPGARWLDGAPDKAGNMRKCPPNSFPKLLPRLDMLLRYETLEDYFRKYPSKKGTDSLQKAMAHEYAYGYKNENIIGQGADFSVWQPAVETSSEFSLSQLWCSAGSGNEKQTVELGWQEYPSHYGDSQPRLFIYFTTNGYSSSGNNTGCYNLDCTGFVQVNGDVVIGGALTPISTVGGEQYCVTLETYRDPANGNWWIRWDGDTWLGYYPTELFSLTGLKYNSGIIEFGGEIFDDGINGHTMTDMGSGRFPSEGWGNAAWTRDIHYWDTGGSYQQAFGLTTARTNSDYYDIELIETSTDPEWGVYYFFGGPGAR